MLSSKSITELLNMIYRKVASNNEEYQNDLSILCFDFYYKLSKMS